MERRVRLYATFIILILLVGGLYSFTNWFSRITGYFTGEDEKTKMALCLREQQAEFYGNEYCADCEKQIKLFGRSFEKLSYVDCGSEVELCPGIDEVPAWHINKTIYYGYKNFSELKEISGCVI